MAPGLRIFRWMTWELPTGKKCVFIAHNNVTHEPYLCAGSVGIFSTIKFFMQFTTVLIFSLYFEASDNLLNTITNPVN